MITCAKMKNVRVTWMVIITLATTVHLSKAVTDFSSRKEKLKNQVGEKGIS